MTPTAPSGTEVATGQIALASGSDAAHLPSDAIDALVGGPSGQNPLTYWLADGPAVPAQFATRRSWRVILASVQTVSAIQVRLALGSAGPTSGYVLLQDDFGRALITMPLALGQVARDGDVLGVAFTPPIAGTRDVIIIFDESPTGAAPGLRTVAVYAQ